MARRGARRREAIWLLPPLVLTAAVYLPITRNYFHSSDFAHFTRIADYTPQQYILLQAGGHITLFRNSIYTLLNRAFGVDPRPYFWLALALHLINVALLWRVIRGFTRSAKLACFGSALWGVCLLHEGALGWWSAHGHMYATTAMLLVLAHLASSARRAAPPSRHARLLWYALALIASTSFGVGIGFALALPLLAILLVPRWRSVWRTPPCLTLWVVVPALYLTILRLNEMMFEQALVAPIVGSSLFERGRSIPAALVRLAAFGTERLAAGLFPLPTLATLSYLPLALLLLAALVVAARTSRKRRAQLAAWGLLTVALYGMIAAGRGFFLEHATVGELLQLKYYSYAPLVPVTLAICTLLKEIAAASRLPAAVKTGLLALWTAASLAIVVTAPPRFDQYDTERAAHRRALAEISCHINSSVPGETIYFFSPFRAGTFLGAYPSNFVDGHRVFFLVDRPPRRLKNLDQRSKDLYVARIALTPRQNARARRLQAMCTAPRRPEDAELAGPDQPAETAAPAPQPEP